MIKRADKEAVPILIFSDICIYREGLKSALIDLPGLKEALTAANVDSALQHIKNSNNSIVLVDLASSEAAGLLTRLPRNGHHIVVLTLSGDPRELLDCVEAGAIAFLSRNDSLVELRSCIQSLLEGAHHYSPAVSELFVASASLQHRWLHQRRCLSTLTSRQVEIMSLVDQGLPNKAIARAMHLEVSTVKNHIHNILGKLHVKTRGQAAAMYRKQRDQISPL